MTISNGSNSNKDSNHEAAGNSLAIGISEALAGSPVASTGAGRPAKVAVSFMTRETDAQFIVTTGSILAGMTGNSAFPAPVPSLSDLTTARDAYLAAVIVGRDSRLGRSLRQKTREALVGLLRQLAHYVEDTGAGDRTILLSSGFRLQRERAPVGPLPAPEDLRLALGKVSGNAVARCRRNLQARAYEWRLAPAATPTAWAPVVITFAAHAEFEGLAPVTVYVVQVRAVSTAGPGDWSTTAAALVL